MRHLKIDDRRPREGLIVPVKREPRADSELALLVGFSDQDGFLPGDATSAPEMSSDDLSEVRLQVHGEPWEPWEP